MRLFVTVALPGPNYNNAFPPELNITTFQVFFLLRSLNGAGEHMQQSSMWTFYHGSLQKLGSCGHPTCAWALTVW